MELPEIGRVISSGEGCFQWIIDDFLLQVPIKEEKIRSPYFRFSGASYYLQSYIDKDEYMELCNTDNVPKLSVKLGLKTKNSAETPTGETDDDGSFSVEVWKTVSEMLTGRREILQYGCLTVFCSLKTLDVVEKIVLQDKIPSVYAVAKRTKACESDSDEDEPIISIKALKKLRKDFKNLLDSGKERDVTFQVQGKKFLAHRSILSARSPVFESMFTHQMAEKQSGVVVIEDCDPVTFPDFLNYLYTGSIKHISDRNACQLYTDADKYDVEELKEGCAVFMKRNLSVGKFCDIMTLAVRHNERELVDSAMDFFCRNSREIIRSTRWQTYFHENPTVGNELINKLLASGNSYEYLTDEQEYD